MRLEPRPALEMKSVIEAKHWAATYALYRVGFLLPRPIVYSDSPNSSQFCNNIQLNRVLPEGPRQYWKQLEEQHRTAPDHLKWQYDPDPFTAQLAVEERQRKAVVKREKQSVQKDQGDDLAVLKKRMEVRMGDGLRELVENAIKKVCVVFHVLADV